MTLRTLSLLSFIALAACTDKAANNGDANVDSGAIGTGAEDADNDGFTTDEDCDDNDGTINPGATEICDGVDNDCDGEIDENVTSTFYRDADGDGFGDAATATESCEIPAGYVPNANDCDDAQGSAFPGNNEDCDGIDNDCDGDVDEGVTTTYYADGDGDSFGDPAAVTEACTQPPGTVTNDGDCDDTTAAAFPGNIEVCDEIDNDCDLTVDEGVTTTYYADLDNDSYGDPGLIQDACALPSGYAVRAGDCNDSDPTTNPAASEYCDGHDDDCDGTVDEDDAVDAADFYADTDADGYGNPSALRHTCYQPTGYVSDRTDCDDTRAATNPGATEYCNTHDDDCDGTIDESDAADAPTWYADTDNDSYGNPSSSIRQCTQPTGYQADNTDCDDTYAGTYPGADEYCDSRDNDCDGTVDEDGEVLDGDTFYRDADSDLVGDPDITLVACTQPSGYVDNYYDCDDTDNSEPVVVDRGTGSSSGSGTMADPLYDLQDGIDRASACVIAFGGTYRENIVIDANLDIWGVEGSDLTVIDSNGTPCDGASPTGCEPAVSIATGTGISPTLRGFSITGGTGQVSTSTTTTTCADSSASHSGQTTCTVHVYEYCGGGLYVDGDDPVLEDLQVVDNTLPEFEQYTVPCGGTACNFEQNWLYSYGGGVCLKDSAASLEDVHVYDNFADQGGGVYVGDAAVVDWSHSYIAENEAGDGGGLNLDGATLSATNVLFAFNDADTDGGGIFSQNAGAATLVNSNSAYNTSATGASRGDAVYGSSGTTMTVMNSILQTNSNRSVVYSVGTWTGSYNDVYNAGTGTGYAGTAVAGTGSVTGNPQWQSVTDDNNIWNDDWSLRSTSPALNTGNPSSTYNDADGSRNDMGITGGAGGTWP